MRGMKAYRRRRFNGEVLGWTVLMFYGLPYCRRRRWIDSCQLACLLAFSALILDRASTHAKAAAAAWAWFQTAALSFHSELMVACTFGILAVAIASGAFFLAIQSGGSSSTDLTKSTPTAEQMAQFLQYVTYVTPIPIPVRRRTHAHQ